MKISKSTDHDYLCYFITIVYCLYSLLEEMVNSKQEALIVGRSLFKLSEHLTTSTTPLPGKRKSMDNSLVSTILHLCFIELPCL